MNVCSCQFYKRGFKGKVNCLKWQRLSDTLQPLSVSKSKAAQAVSRQDYTEGQTALEKVCLKCQVIHTHWRGSVFLDLLLFHCCTNCCNLSISSSALKVMSEGVYLIGSKSSPVNHLLYAVYACLLDKGNSAPCTVVCVWLHIEFSFIIQSTGGTKSLKETLWSWMNLNYFQFCTILKSLIKCKWMCDVEYGVVHDAPMRLSLKQKKDKPIRGPF